jgi:hypothetical protein
MANLLLDDMSLLLRGIQYARCQPRAGQSQKDLNTLDPGTSEPS